jgi:exosortase F-associated protein
MLKNKFTISGLRIAGIVLLIVVFACIRIFQETLFYDPLLEFFKHEDKVVPQYDGFKLFLSLGFRYFLNSAVSVGILWLAFKDGQVVKLSAILLACFFIVLAVILFIVLGLKEPNLLLVFYIRRFLIQPLFLILFLPAFYYQRHLQ